MEEEMKIGILQLNFKVGDFALNTQKILEGYRNAVEKGATLVVTSELALFGYPPGDMLLRNDYLKQQNHNLERLSQCIDGAGLILGVASSAAGDAGMPLYNSAALIQNKKIVFLQHKCLLPNYDVFDEKRYFEALTEPTGVIQYNGRRLGILICEDIWSDVETIAGKRMYRANPVDAFARRPIDVLLTINASPFYTGKTKIRRAIARSIVRKLKCPLIYANQVGGNDELIFDGQSFAMDRGGEFIARAMGFSEQILVFDIETSTRVQPGPIDATRDLLDALILGTRDYVLKSTGKSPVLVALSGGIDSAVTACIASRALGPENVCGVGMPSAFSSEGSVADARQLAENLGIRFELIPIGQVYDIFGKTLEPVIDWRSPGSRENDVTEENIQARIRGAIMMAISNRRGGIVLSTGNKSELSVGYCTLYGDMAGGFAVLSDVYKTKVYDLARHINRDSEIIPWNTINKAPSAELSPDQRDQDSLPPYDVLDAVLAAYIEQGLEEDDIAAQGFDSTTVRWIINRLNANEYKRRQMAPGLKVTQKAFGIGRRLPIAARF
jgi:NAD+ synthase (glutamine-hydrolysing)